MANYNFRYDDIEDKLYFINPSGEEIQIGTGAGITIEALSVTENGTYTAQEGKAYSPVTVNVPQTIIEALSVTENGTYTAQEGKAYSPITVNVPGRLSEVVKGTIKIEDGQPHIVSIPYSGNGKIEAIIITISGGNGNTQFNNLILQYAFHSAILIAINSVNNHAFSGSTRDVDNDLCLFSGLYKNSLSSPASLNVFGYNNTNFKDASIVQTAIKTSINIKSNTTFEIGAASSGSLYGLAPNFEYDYYAIYYEPTT